MINLKILPNEIVSKIILYLDPKDCRNITGTCKFLYSFRRYALCNIFKNSMNKILSENGHNLKTFFPEKKQYPYRITGSSMVKCITNLPFKPEDIDIFYDMYPKNLHKKLPNELYNIFKNNINSIGDMDNNYETRIGYFKLQGNIDLVCDGYYTKFNYEEKHRDFDITICRSYFDGLNWVVYDPEMSFNNISTYSDNGHKIARIIKYQERGIKIKF